MTNPLLWRRSVLPNGLTVLQLPRQSANTTQLSVAVEYGSNQEPPENAGVAHFLEHMIAGGSTKRIQLSRSVENAGGILGFYTDHERMMATMDVLPENLEAASLVLSELLFDSDFENEKLMQERKIILSELAEASDDPAERIDELLLPSLFKNHPVKRPVGGYPKTVKQLSLEHLCNAHKANYIPQNMVLILTGSFSEQTSKAALNGFRNKRSRQTLNKRTVPLEDAKPKPLVIEKKPGIAQTYLSVGLRTVCSTHSDAPALDLVSMLLCGGTSSRLFVELREKHALTYDVNCDHNKGVDFGYFSVNCAVKDKNLVKANKLILSELSRLQTEKVPADELERNKNLIVAGILRGMDSPPDCADILAYIEMQFKSERSLAAYIDRVKAVSSDGIMAAAKTYLQKDCLSTVMLEPK